MGVCMCVCVVVQFACSVDVWIHIGCVAVNVEEKQFNIERGDKHACMNVYTCIYVYVASLSAYVHTPMHTTPHSSA